MLCHGISNFSANLSGRHDFLAYGTSFVKLRRMLTVFLDRNSDSLNEYERLKYFHDILMLTHPLVFVELRLQASEDTGSSSKVVGELPHTARLHVSRLICLEFERIHRPAHWLSRTSETLGRFKSHRAR